MRRALVVAFVLLALGSCGGQPATPDNTPRQSGVGEETTSEETTADELAGGETTEPAAPTTVAAPEESALREGPASRSTPQEPAVGTNGMVSSADSLATRAGLDVLEDGGNAFDAAVAISAALGVAEPMMSGVGGYGVYVMYDAESGEVRSLDSAGRVPEALDPNVFYPPTSNYEANRRGLLTVTTPGMTNTWEALHREYGELEWRRLMAPAISMAERGFPISERSSYYIAEEFYDFPEHVQEVYGNEGAPLQPGERLVQSDLGRSLRRISTEGAQALHGGDLGQAVDSYMRENGGFLSMEDLRNNRAEWRGTTGINYRGNEVVTAGQPVGAWNGLERLGVMGQFDVAEFEHNSADHLHRYIEVSKRAHEDRLQYAGDPEVDRPPLDMLLSEEYWAEVAANINPSTATAWVEPASVFAGGETATADTGQEQGGYGYTTHFVVADAEGNVVSASLTLGNLFGSKAMAEGTGIWLNDSLAWHRFDPREDVPEIRPGGLRGGGMFPAIVMRDGRPQVAIGTPGGFTINQTMPQMLMNLVDFRMDVQRAISAPRVTFAEPYWLAAESSLPEGIRAELAARGHNITVDNADFGYERGLGNAHGLAVEYGENGRPACFTGGADPRGVGSAEGL